MSDSEAKLEEYRQAFEAENARSYATVEVFISRHGGYQLESLVPMARVLACPLKAKPPNWQHGRVLYALARSYIAARPLMSNFTFLDIGTAKGFSALCLIHALKDGNTFGEVHSLDVIDPAARVARNSVAELDGLKTLAEFMAPWIPVGHVPASALYAYQCPGMFFDRVVKAKRIHLAFVDGKHKLTDVLAEATGIAARQQSGDLILFDDMQVPAVTDAVFKFLGFGGYAHEAIPVIDGDRAYCLATKL